jgi:hypothetical protein
MRAATACLIASCTFQIGSIAQNFVFLTSIHRHYFFSSCLIFPRLIQRTSSALLIAHAIGPPLGPNYAKAYIIFFYFSPPDPTTIAALLTAHAAGPGH